MHGAGYMCASTLVSAISTCFCYFRVSAIYLAREGLAVCVWKGLGSEGVGFGMGWVNWEGGTVGFGKGWVGYCISS